MLRDVPAHRGRTISKGNGMDDDDDDIGWMVGAFAAVAAAVAAVAAVVGVVVVVVTSVI